MGKGKICIRQNQIELGAYVVKKLCGICQSDAVVFRSSTWLCLDLNCVIDWIFIWCVSLSFMCMPVIRSHAESIYIKICSQELVTAYVCLAYVPDCLAQVAELSIEFHIEKI